MDLKKLLKKVKKVSKTCLKTCLCKENNPFFCGKGGERIKRAKHKDKGTGQPERTMNAVPSESARKQMATHKKIRVDKEKSNNCYKHMGKATITPVLSYIDTETLLSSECF